MNIVTDAIRASHPQVVAFRTPVPDETHTPRKNHLLAGLPSNEYERLLPNLQAVTLSRGRNIRGAGNGAKYLYFITAGLVSRFYLTAAGASFGTTIAGNEGVIGLDSFLGENSMLSNEVVLYSGCAYRLQANIVKSEIERNGMLSRLLLRYTNSLISQTGQVAMCNCHHSLEQRLCRLILTSLDRLPSGELMMTHGLIADMLGVRREAISLVAGKLQKAGLICYGRAKMVVIERSQLEARACECYGTMRRDYCQVGPLHQDTESLNNRPFRAANSSHRIPDRSMAFA